MVCSALDDADNIPGCGPESHPAYQLDPGHNPFHGQAPIPTMPDRNVLPEDGQRLSPLAPSNTHSLASCDGLNAPEESNSPRHSGQLSHAVNLSTRLPAKSSARSSELDTPGQSGRSSERVRLQRGMFKARRRESLAEVKARHVREKNRRNQKAFRDRCKV
jgi:hypothetical protein